MVSKTKGWDILWGLSWLFDFLLVGENVVESKEWCEMPVVKLRMIIIALTNEKQELDFIVLIKM